METGLRFHTIDPCAVHVTGSENTLPGTPVPFLYLAMTYSRPGSDPQRFLVALPDSHKIVIGAPGIRMRCPRKPTICRLDLGNGCIGGEVQRLEAGGASGLSPFGVVSGRVSVVGTMIPASLRRTVRLTSGLELPAIKHKSRSIVIPPLA